MKDNIKWGIISIAIGWNRQIVKAVAYPVLAVALLINTGGLLLLMFKPACDGKQLQDDDLVMLLACYHERAELERLGFVEEKRSMPRWIEKIEIN